MEGGRLASRLAPGAFHGSRARRIHRALLRTTEGPLRPLWSLAYRGAVRACSVFLRVGVPGATTYVGGSLASGRPVYGVADLDLTVVLPDAAAPNARARVRARWKRLTRAVPMLADLVDCCVYDESHLRAAQRDSAITYGLGDGGRSGAGPAVYHGPLAGEDVMLLLERPELYGPTASWRRVAGPERLHGSPDRDAQRRRIAAWLELQFLWRLAVELCLDPARPGAASMCVKLVAEPARIWMWLTGGERTGGRAQTVSTALSRLPDEAPALERALWLQRNLIRSPEPPLAESLRAFVRLSARIARTLADELDAAGSTAVELLGGDDLVLPHGGWEPTGPWPASPAPPVLALADWRAIAYPTIPDETFAPIGGDPGNPAELARAARVLDKGPYPTLASAGLLIRPFHGGRARLRAVSCRSTDPVSFAVMEGATSAAFPDLAGWSARDTARRGVAEHGAWLVGHSMPPEPSGQHLGLLLAAARAALFLESLDAGRPQLALTGAATAGALADRVTGARDAIEAAWAAYRTFAVDWLTPDPTAVAALDHVVRGLAPYVR